MIKKAGSTLVGQLITKELIVAALKKVGVRLAAKQIAKFVPIAGQVVAAVFSGSAMLYIGYAHIDECCEVVRKALENRAENADAISPAEAQRGLCRHESAGLLNSNAEPWAFQE